MNNPYPCGFPVQPKPKPICRNGEICKWFHGVGDACGREPQSIPTADITNWLPPAKPVWDGSTNYF